MNIDIAIPEKVRSRVEFKRRFSLIEMYSAFIYVPRALKMVSVNKQNKLVNPDLLKRLELAVTEVNGCLACSYQHTKMALRQGMSGEEISSFLSGDTNLIKPEEAKAIMFAQHFADSRGYPKKYAFNTIIEEYGKKEAHVMLSTIQIMIAGNMYGIPFSAFQSRRNGKPFKDSSLFFELGMLIAGIFIMPIAFIHGGLRGLFGLSNIKFDKSTSNENEGFTNM
ncbi:carboxymuconolactone decarboxylase family protein [Bizionia argentinensis JUB59]|uniref:Carboxymuconolactone decarboxylase family protein n=1 Tax=Bizionia argentinensis JUB59 TaxID=1046627 RepID=G2ECW3_9FLAO|nr:carboxymuconolactone decarboxylase family protein [Bizionia argentinensis]EGV43713.1 carboxymuconolactone decarboxylase family protein [Bizionia argentinensis JUB59]